MSKKKPQQWSYQEVKALVDGYEKGQTFTNLAKAIGRSEDGIRLKLYELRSIGQAIQQRKLYPDDWSAVEDEFLMQNLSHLSPTQLSGALNRTVAAIKKRSKQLDLIKTPAKRKAYKKRRDTTLAKQFSNQLPEVMGMSRIGHRPHLGITVRSSWENNVLVWLNHRKIKWEYEPTLFTFENVLRGARSYLPDIYLPKQDIYIEVKGRLLSVSKTKTRRFKQYYPDEFAKLQVIVQRNSEAHKFYQQMNIPVYAYYDELVKKFSHLKNWEGKK